jgi:4-diphosphocytidyl-2-C-methyl-D-erythritol kinase
MASFFSPAKLNLLLSIHGKRSDGYHDLTSIIVGLDFGDYLEVSIHDQGFDSLTCSDPITPVDETNLILKMASSLRDYAGIRTFFSFRLIKNIPLGAGLGGASSNAVCALKAMCSLLDLNLEDSIQHKLASSVGSDCSFFIKSVPSIMEGRGERILPLEESLHSVFSGREVLLFKPSFSIATSEAYACLQAKDFEEKQKSLDRIESFAKSLDYSKFVYNSFTNPISDKYLIIKILLKALRDKDFICDMTGSGSTCFALLSKENPSKDVLLIKKILEEVLGPNIFISKATIL